jgi:hypothetical protein
MEKAGIAVSYNLFYGKSGNLAGYRLTLIMRNNTGSKQVFEPVLSLQDATGFIIPPYEYQAFVTEHASLAGTAVPIVPISSQTNYYHSGTIRNTATGNTLAYSGTTTSTPGGGPIGALAQGFAQGRAQRTAINAANDREEGRKMLRSLTRSGSRAPTISRPVLPCRVRYSFRRHRPANFPCG